MDRGDFLAAVGARVIEGELSDPRGGFFSDDFQTFHDSGDDFMLDAGIKSLGVFPHDDKSTF